MKLKALVRAYLRRKWLPFQPALTFNDVLIKPKISDINSRSELQDLSTPIARDFSLRIPITSANMDKVTGSRMAIAMARLGGLGFIPQFDSFENRLKEVSRVKREDNAVIKDPLTIHPDATLAAAREVMARHSISSLLVTKNDGTLVGILTSRDIQFKTDASSPVRWLMTKQPLVTAHYATEIKKLEKIIENRKVEKLPLVDNKGKVRGLLTRKDIAKRLQNKNALRDKKGRLAVGASLWLKGDYVNEAGEFLRAGADVLLLDTARGGATLVFEATRGVRRRFPEATIIAGNVATPEEVEYLARAGADCIKVGIGPGSACSTREETGVGVPQIHAVATCVAVAKHFGVPVIADGSIEKGGHLAKALGAGASAVMIGGLFAGTDESPGLVRFDKKKQIFVKRFFGSASQEQQELRMQKGNLDAMRHAEGESGDVPYIGSVHEVVWKLLGGLRSSMSYVGAHNLKEFEERVEFIWQTAAGYEEGKPRI